MNCFYDSGCWGLQPLRCNPRRTDARIAAAAHAAAAAAARRPPLSKPQAAAGACLLTHSPAPPPHRSATMARKFFVGGNWKCVSAADDPLAGRAGIAPLGIACMVWQRLWCHRWW